MAIFFRRLSAAMPWLLLLPGAWAQIPVAHPPTPPVPVAHDAARGVVAALDVASGLQYVSVLEQYQAYAEQAVTSWPKANATVERIGGWRAYAKEIAAHPGTPQPHGAQP